MNIFPHLIHQIKFGETKKYDKFDSNIEHLKKLNSKFHYHLWNEEKAWNLIIKKYPEYFNFYKKLNILEKTDFFRYILMYEYGGFYFDLDMEFHNSLDSFFDNTHIFYRNVRGVDLLPDKSTAELFNPFKYDIIFSAENYIKNGESYVNNFCLISKPKQEFWKYLLDITTLKVNEEDVLFKTGCMVLTEAINTFKPNALILPPFYFGWGTYMKTLKPFWVVSSHLTEKTMSTYTNNMNPPTTPQITSTGPIGVTVTSPSYEHLTNEAVNRFRKHSGLEVIVLPCTSEPAFAHKLNLDLLVAPRKIVYFDIDLWLIRDFDFTSLANNGRFNAVPDPGAWNPFAFPHTDSVNEGWDKSEYFNSGLFICDLADPKIKKVFEDARKTLEECHNGKRRKPIDWTDQFFLNHSIQQQPGLLKRLPFQMNFYKKAVDWGSYPFIPRDIIGLHAAGEPKERKLEALHEQSKVLGSLNSEMISEAINHYYNQSFLNGN